MFEEGVDIVRVSRTKVVARVFANIDTEAEQTHKNTATVCHEYAQSAFAESWPPKEFPVFRLFSHSDCKS